MGRKVSLLNFVLAMTLTFLSFLSFSQEKGKFNLILDTDMAIDDWPAVLYVLNQKKRAKFLGITGTGEVHCKFAIKNVLDLVHLAGIKR